MNAIMNCIYIRKLWMVNCGIGSLTRAQEKRVNSFLFSPRGNENVVHSFFKQSRRESPGTTIKQERDKKKSARVAAKGIDNDAELLTSTKYRREKRKLTTRWDDTPSGDVCLQCGTAQTQERTRQTEIIIPLLRRRRRKYTLSLINTPRFRAVTSIIS
jgi:hypothetical protein